MQRSDLRYTITFLLLMALIAGCAPAPTPKTEDAPAQEAIVEEQPTELPPTDPPPPTATIEPTPTPLPGLQVLPLDSFAHEIPWLPYDTSAVPGTYFFFFNAAKPPFNSALVRQAFSAAIDREALLTIVDKYAAGERSAATTFTPPSVLGRDLYQQVGISYDPSRAASLLNEAGYEDPSAFPTVTLLTNTAGGGTPYLHINLAEEMGRMLGENLGVSVVVEYLEWGPYLERVKSDPPDIFRLSWAADYNDPDNFLRELFASGMEYNWGNFSNSEFDDLVEQAAEETDPAIRQELYIQAERILSELEAGMIPIYHGTWSVQ